MGIYSISGWNAGCLVRHAQMARKLCLQNHFKLVGFCAGRFTGTGNCVADSELAELEGCHEESGGGVAIRVIS